MVQTSKTINIKPGYHEDSVLIFPGEGHQTVHGVTSDLLFDVYELPHPCFTRKGDNLIYTHILSLSEALNCSSISVITLDKRNIQVSIDSIVRYNLSY